MTTSFFSRVRVLATLAMACVCLLGAIPAKAVVVSVVPTPGTAQVAVPNGSAVTISWRVQRANTVTPPQVTLISTVGTIAFNGTTIATINTTVSQLNNTPVGGRTFSTIVETLQVPPNVAFQMAQNPNATVTYSRTFSDTSATLATGVVTLLRTGTGSGGLGIRRLDLTFDDGGRIKILPEGEKLYAQAEINFDGSGNARFQWQIAEPGSTRGTLIFRNLQIISRALGGRSRVTLRSPPLPTKSPGVHVVRLLPLSPGLGFDAPQIRYFVTPGRAIATGPVNQKITVLGPTEGAALTTDLKFSWRPTPGAAVYQIEIYPLQGGEPSAPSKAESIGGALLVYPDGKTPPPITGVALPGDRQSISLKSYSLAHLTAGQTYLWRVKAISGGGSVIGASALRRLSMPR